MPKFNRIAKGIIENNLGTSDSFHDVVTKVQSGSTKSFHLGCKVVYRHLNSIPTTCNRLATIWHGLRPRATRSAKQQS